MFQAKTGTDNAQGPQASNMCTAAAKAKRWGTRRGNTATAFRESDLSTEPQQSDDQETNSLEVQFSFQHAAKTPELAAQPHENANEARKLRKALREISDLEQRVAVGRKLRLNQLAKIDQKEGYIRRLAVLSDSVDDGVSRKA